MVATSESLRRLDPLRRWLAPWTLASLSCVSDLAAPDCYNAGATDGEDRCMVAGLPDESSDDGDSGGSSLAFDCTEIAQAAVGAEFNFTPPTAIGPLEWRASGLPPGLNIDPQTGQISGVPTDTGEYTIEITVDSGVGTPLSVSCDTTVRDALTLELEQVFLQTPACLDGTSQTLLDLVMNDTGDGSPITCTHAAGLGGGRLPSGIELDPERCRIQGTLTEPRLGSYAFVVRGTQSGRDVYVPYCLSQAQEGGYTVSLSHSSLDGTPLNPTLTPITRRYRETSFSLLDDDGPTIEITDDDACTPMGCFIGYVYRLSGSLFDPSTFDLEQLEILSDPMGFRQQLHLSGPSNDVSSDTQANFATRPWVVTIDIDYCLAADAETCSTSNDVQTNGEAGLTISAIMLAE